MYIYVRLAEGPGVDREKKYLKKKLEFFIVYNPPRPPLSVQKNFSSNGPAVWPAIGNIFLYECLV